MPKNSVEKIEIPLKKWNQYRSSSEATEILKSHTELVNDVELTKEEALVPLELLASIIAIPTENTNTQADLDYEYFHEFPSKKEKPKSDPTLYDALVEEELATKARAEELKELMRLQDQFNQEEAATFRNTPEGQAILNLYYQHAQPVLPVPPAIPQPLIAPPPPPPRVARPILPPLRDLLPGLMLPMMMPPRPNPLTSLQPSIGATRMGQPPKRHNEDEEEENNIPRKKR